MTTFRFLIIPILCGWMSLSYAIGFSDPLKVLPEQKRITIQQNFQDIYRASTEVGVDPQTMQAISLVETRGGVFGVGGNPASSPSTRSYGLMQIQPATALVILRDHPELVDKFFNGVKPSYSQVIRFLTTNSYGSAVMAAYLFKDYGDMLNSNWCLTVLGYNMGIGVALKARRCEQNLYVQNVRWFLTNIVRKYNITN